VGSVRFPPVQGTYFEALARSIIYQQLAGAAARTIHGRFLDVLEHQVTPGRVMAAAESSLREAGLSRAKAASISDLATRVSSGEVSLEGLEELDASEVKDRLTRVRGIGPWTADMFLMFTLRRPDIWPTGDLGVRQGMGRLLGWAAAPTADQLELIGVGYRPWRSAAAWYCWRALEG